MNKIKLIVAGGRDFQDKTLMFDSLEEFLIDLVFDDLEIVCGMADGADMLGREIALEADLHVEEMPAKWKDMTEPCVTKVNSYSQAYNALAGNKRNKQMADYATHLIAFWDGKSKGTKDMIMLALKQGLVVKVVTY